jgi:hypothetical protein
MMKILKMLIALSTVFVLSTACEKEISKDQQVYYNDFEDGSLNGITGGILSDFNGQVVIGNYFDDGFTLKIAELPKHDYIVIKCQLMVHDSWDGNQQLPDGPDLWRIILDESSRDTFETSFSNSPCRSTYCLLQSYPETFPFPELPKTGAGLTGLPAFCKENSTTSMYNLIITFPHKSETASIKFYDDLTQTNTSDKKCDESWSINEVEIRIWSIN